MTGNKELFRISKYRDRLMEYLFYPGIQPVLGRDFSPDDDRIRSA